MSDTTIYGSAGRPVRLDPFQNIVAVHWGGPKWIAANYINIFRKIFSHPSKTNSEMVGLCPLINSTLPHPRYPGDVGAGATFMDQEGSLRKVEYYGTYDTTLVEGKALPITNISVRKGKSWGGLDTINAEIVDVTGFPQPSPMPTQESPSVLLDTHTVGPLLYRSDVTHQTDGAFTGTPFPRWFDVPASVETGIPAPAQEIEGPLGVRLFDEGLSRQFGVYAAEIGDPIQCWDFYPNGGIRYGGVVSPGYAPENETGMEILGYSVELAGAQIVISTGSGSTAEGSLSRYNAKATKQIGGSTKFPNGGAGSLWVLFERE